MLISKNKAEALTNLREPNLRIIFQILIDVKEQLIWIPKAEHKKTEKLFEIMSKLSLLHNQIFHLSKEQSSTKQIYDHILRLHRINLEKSIYDYFDEKEFEKEKEKEKKKKLQKETTTSFSTLVVESSQNSFTEITPIKEKDMLRTKINRQIENEQKKYLKVNRTLQSNRQRQIPSPIKIKAKIVKNNKIQDNNIIDNNINLIDNRQSAPLLPNTCKKKKTSKLAFEETKPPLKKAFSKTSSNFHTINIDKTYKWMPFTLYSEVKTPKKRKNKHMLLTEKSFDKRQNCHTNREIGKPSTYAKYLLSKYRDVIENYGEEMKHSLNTSTKLHRSSSRKEESKERQLIEITPYHNVRSNSLLN